MLMVTRLDVLVRSTPDLLNILDMIAGAGAGSSCWTKPGPTPRQRTDYVGPSAPLSAISEQQFETKAQEMRPLLGMIHEPRAPRQEP